MIYESEGENKIPSDFFSLEKSLSLAKFIFFTINLAPLKKGRKRGKKWKQLKSEQKRQRQRKRLQR